MSVLLVQYEAQRGWVSLPVNPSLDLDTWCEERAEEVYERFIADGEEAERNALLRDLKKQSDKARGRDLQSSCAFYASGIHTALAFLDVEVLVPSDNMPVLDIPNLSEALKSDELAAPDVHLIDLEVGPAVRIRQNVLGDRRWKFGPRDVLHTLTYGVRPSEYEQAIVMRAWWTSAVIDELVPEAVDEIVSSLILTEASD